MTIRPRHLLFPLLLALPLCSLTARAQQAAGLQQRMSSEEFKAAGLEKLSPQELANLDSWLQTHNKITKQLVTTTGKPVFYPDSGKRTRIDAHIPGRFEGWNGHNEFKLDNGQTWRQVGEDKASCMAGDNLAVKIKPSLFGNWLMYVHGCNDDVHVERVH